MLKLLAMLAMLLLSQALLLTGHGLQLTLLPLRADLEGFTLTEIGLTGTMYFLGFTLGCIGTPLIARRAGHIRTFAILASVGSALALIFPLVDHRVDAHHRAAVVVACPFVQPALDEHVQAGDAPAGAEAQHQPDLASILFSAALVPVALSTDAPAPIRAVRIRPGVLWRTSHVACTGSFLAGAATGAFWGLGPVFAGGAGLSTFQVTLFIAAAVAGGALSQLPLGRLSDHYDRRLVVLGAATVAMAVALLLTAFPTPAPAVLIGLSFAFGAFAMPLYALSVAHANDRAGPDEFVVVGSGVLMLFGLGSAAGAPLAGVLMGVLGRAGLFAFVALALGAMMVGVARRRQVRVAPLHQESEQPFVAVSELAPMALDLDPRATGGDEAVEPELEPERAASAGR